MEECRAWLTAFGTQLGRIELADAAETERVRALAAAIAATSWVQTAKLEVIPYLDGVPAGTARLTDILWLDGKLFVSPLSKAKLAKRVPEEIGRSLAPIFARHWPTRSSARPRTSRTISRRISRSALTMSSPRRPSRSSPPPLPAVMATLTRLPKTRAATPSRSTWMIFVRRKRMSPRRSPNSRRRQGSRSRAD
ncbi:hypothetical protein ACFSTI_00365 [Rhizorhabdus histidinilytica]